MHTGGRLAQEARCLAGLARHDGLTCHIIHQIRHLGRKRLLVCVISTVLGRQRGEARSGDGICWPASPIRAQSGGHAADHGGRAGSAPGLRGPVCKGPGQAKVVNLAQAIADLCPG